MKLESILLKLKETLGDLYSPTVMLVKIVAIFLLAMLAVRIGSAIIRKFFNKQKSFKYGIGGRKLDTIATLLVSIYRYTVYIVAGVVILSDILDIKAVLAAAGIGGVALGFGAQSLVKDIISGFFIILEDQYVVGDMITIDTMSGTVEGMELRITKLRNFNGDLYIIPNGEIKKLTNHSRGNRAVIVDVPLAYSADVDKAFELAENICSQVAGELDTFVEQPKVLGITELGKDNLNLRITATTLPNEQWEVERRIRKLVKERFSSAGIRFNDRFENDNEKRS